MKKILLLNGPNLNLVGRREPEIYGDKTFGVLMIELEDEFSEKAEIEYYQSNHEGALIDKIHEIGFDYDGIILNAGGYTHTSIALADAVSAVPCKVVEVHISNIYEREEFRHHSYLKTVCDHHIIGKGMDGYTDAVIWLLKNT